MEWLTLKEAAKFVNKSELTIKRLIDKSKIDQTIDQLIYKKEPAKRGYYWFVEKNSLLKYYGLINLKIDQKISNNKLNDQLNKALNDTVEILKNQLQEKDFQIKELSERLKEAQYIIANTHKPKKLENKNIKKGLLSGLLSKYGL